MRSNCFFFIRRSVDGNGRQQQRIIASIVDVPSNRIMLLLGQRNERFIVTHLEFRSNKSTIAVMMGSMKVDGLESVFARCLATLVGMLCGVSQSLEEIYMKRSVCCCCRSENGSAVVLIVDNYSRYSSSIALLIAQKCAEWVSVNINHQSWPRHIVPQYPRFLRAGPAQLPS